MNYKKVEKQALVFLIKSEVLSIVGESGCGKSTTAKLILKIEEPTGEKILFNGEDITKLQHHELEEYRKKVQIIFQDPYSSLNPRWKVGAIIGEPLKLNTNMSKKEIKERVSNLLLDLQKGFNLTYIFISHDLSVVEHISDRIIVMYFGDIVELKSMDDLLRNPEANYTKKPLSAIPTIKD